MENNPTNMVIGVSITLVGSGLFLCSSVTQFILPRISFFYSHFIHSNSNQKLVEKVVCLDTTLVNKHLVNTKESIELNLQNPICSLKSISSDDSTQLLEQLNYKSQALNYLEKVNTDFFYLILIN